MSDFLKRRIQERDEQRRGTQETSAPASSFLQQRIQQRDTQRAESGYRAPTGTHKTMLGMSLEEYKAKLDEALAAWKSTSATTESGLANPKEAQARKTYQTMRKQYKALQQRESEKQQAQAAQQEYDELRVADLNALKAKMDAAKESADGSAKERVVAGSIVKQKDSGAQAAYEEAARKYNLAQQIQYDERGALALGKLSEEEAAAVDTLAKSTNKGRKTDIVGAGVIDEMRRKATKVLTDAGYSAEEIDELANWRARQQNAQKYDAAVEKREALADKGFWGAAAATALSVPETLASGIGVIDVAVQNYENRGTDRPADYKRTAMLPYAMAKAGRSTISNKLEQNTDAEIFGQNVAAGAYNIGTSMLDSTAVAGLAALGVPPLAATSLLGGAAATSAMVDAKDRGVSDEQAVLTGLAAGVAESLFEEVSLEKLLKLKPAVGTLGQRVRTTIKNVGLQAATEGSEEFFTTLANTMTDNLINGGLSEFQQNLRGYMEQGMSEEEARRRAYLDLAGQLALDFGGGAIAGGLMAGGQTAIQTGQRNAAIAQEYGDIARGAAQERLETNEGDRLAQDVQNRVSSNRRVGGGAIAELVSRNVQAQNAQTQTAIAEAAAQRLTELGETENVETVAQAAAQLTADPTMSAGRRRAAENVLKGSRYGERVLGELTEGMQAGSAESAPAAVQEESAAPSVEQVRQAVESTQRSRGAQNLTESRGGEERTQSGRRFASEWAGNLPQVLTEDAYVRRLKELRVNPQATDSRTVTGTAYNKESGKLDVIVWGTDGKVETIPAAKAATTARQERLMELAADVGEAGPQMFAAIRDGQDVETYARQWKNAYTYGESNIPRAYAIQSDAVKYLTAEQRDIAYEAGKAAYDQKQAKAREKRAAKGNDTPKAKKGTVKLTGAVIGGKRYDGVSKASLTERQRANLKVLGQVAQATGVDIVLYQSRANVRGEYEGQNGAYKDGTLYLDINAGRNRVGDLSEVAVVRTAAHELTHFIQDYNPAAYAEYRDYVVGLLIEEQGMDFDALVEHKQALQNDLSYDEAVDEVVADGSEMLLRDTAAVQRLAEENRGLFQKIRSWLRKWLENIKKAFDGVGAEHAEAKALEKHLEQLQQRWDDALVGASRNLQRSKAEAESAGEKASVRGKYWRPDLNRSEWSLLNRRLEEEIESSGQYLDESTKWLYADEKGVQVFALYGIGDGMEATPLYAVGGKQARADAAALMAYIKEEREYDGNRKDLDTLLEGYGRSNRDGRSNLFDRKRGSAENRTAGLHRGSQGRDAGGTSGRGAQNQPGVKVKFSLRDSAGRELTAAQQDYFKDSKVRDAAGRLKVMYRGGNGDFTVFDRRKSKYSNLYGRGFYFTDSESHAKQYGNARAFYLNITNPVSTTETSITRAQLRKFLEAVAGNEDDFSFENYGYGATVDSVLKSTYGKSDFFMLYDVNQTAIGDMVQAVELFNEVNGTNYNGLILDTETVAFHSNQIKNTDNKTPSSDPDIRYSVRGKYWRPQLRDAEWTLLNRKLDEGIESSEQYLDESTKWLYADEKGVQVFALYGIGDGMEATPLYAVGGKQARYAASLMQDVIEEVGRSDGNAEGFDSWAENLRSKNGNYRRNYAQAGDGKPAGRNAGLHGRSQGRNTGKPAGDGKGKSSGVREKFSLRDSAGRELTAAQQEYFRDSQVRDADGNLLVMYHQTEGAFTVFDTRHKGAGTGDDETPFGIFLKRTARDIGVRGKNQMELYANIRNPLRVRDRAELVERLRELSGTYAELKDQSGKIDKEYGAKFAEAKAAFKNFLLQWRKENPDAPSRAAYDAEGFDAAFDAEDNVVKEWTQKKDELALRAKEAITDALRKNGYDGVILESDRGSWGRSTDAYIALDANQVKNVTNQNPTEDPDIRYSARDYGLTEDEEHAIVSYKSGDSYALNGKLATGGKLTELQRALRDHLDTALEKLPVYRGTVYRHYDFDSFGGYEAMAEFLQLFRKGKPTNIGNYLSASTVRNEDRTGGEYTVDMVIQSETGRSLNGFGRNTENEVLLPRTVRLAVDSMELISPHKIRMMAREVITDETGATADSASTGVRNVRESTLWRDGLRPVSERNSEEVLGQGGGTSGRNGSAGLPGLREGEGSGSMGGSGVESDYRAAEEGLKYQPREQSVSDRQILANALERVAQNERERSILADYREKAAKMAFYERELAKREQKLADHRSGKAVLEPDKIRRAEVSAQKYAALISQQDERLLRLEKLKPLRDVVTRERDYIAERLRGAAEEKSRYTAEFERQLSEERKRGEERLQQYRKGREERDDIRVERRQIEKLAKRLTTYLEENTDKKHIPEALKKPIGELLQSLDFSSKTKLSSGAATKADLAYIRSMQRIDGVLAAQERWDETGEGGDLITGTLDLPKGFREALTEQIERVQTIMETHQPGERAVMRMNLTDLRKLRVMLSTLSSAVTKMNELFANGRFRHVDQAAQDTIFTLREKGQHQSLLPKVESFVRWDNTLPWYAFQRLGEGGQSIFAELQDGWDKLAFNTQKILKFRKELIDDKTARKWDTEVHEVELTDQDDNTVKAKLTTAQLMSLYCLSRRRQALGHLLGGGIRPADIELTANIKDKVLKKTEKQDTHYHLTDERLGQLLGLLTDEQREIAQKMQKYMTEQGATWGNEITMARWGYRAFTEENYFPLTTDREDRPARADDASEGSLYRLQNISATKPLTQNANNAVMLYSIFDVYADHMADMAKYNAMVLPIIDAQKWYNYREGHKNEAGQVSTWTVQRTLTQVYGRDANRFVIQFLKDLNGVKENGARGEGLAKKMISNYKRAAVAANLRVALLQPTAYVRASAVLDAKYLTRAFGERTSTKEATAEMLARSGIGLWKSMGMFDTDVGRSIRDQIKGKGSAVESLVDKTMVLAEKGDSITWARLWRACKLEVADKQHLSGEQLLDATAKRFREVIYRTQVIDSTMTRSHMMRSGSTFAAIFTSFMSEPTVSYNLIMTASEKIWEDTKKYGAKMAVKRNWKTAGRAWQAYILSAVASAMVEALADAWRDPGDDKDTQKLLNAFRDNLGSDLNPLNKLPGLRDIFSIFEGYDTNRTDMAAFSNLNKAIAIWKETVQLADGTIDKATDTTYHGNMTIYGKVYKTAQALSQLSGLPVSATMREAQALWNNTVGRWAPGLKQKTYDNEKQRLIQKAGTAMWNGDKDAWQDAYAALEQYMLADGKSKREAESAVYSEMRKAVKDSYLAGELTETEARQKLVDFLGSDAEKAAQQVTSWKNGSEFAKEVGFEYGEMRSAYETGRIQKSEAVRLRQKYGGETQDEAESKVRYWDFCIEYPQYDDISEARANKYYDYCRQAGVGVAAYYKAAQYTAAIVSEKDEDGNSVSGSVKRQYVEYIQSLGLSAAQQKALWQALKNATWSDKGTPWE